MSEKPPRKLTPQEIVTLALLRAVFRVGRGRSGGSLICAAIVYWAINAGRGVLAADGDPNNPTLSRTFPAEGPNGAPRPATAEMEASRVWLANVLALVVERQTSVVIDMGGGDRVGEELVREDGVAEFLSDSNIRATFAYVTGPEADDFDHIYRIWKSSTLKQSDTILFLNEGLSRSQSRVSDPFGWLKKDGRLDEMQDAGVRIVKVPMLGCMKYIEEGGLTVFDAIAGKPKRDGKPLNPLYASMAKTWLRKLHANLQEEGALEWLP